MHLVIDFNPQVSARLADTARQRGIEPAALVESLVTERLAPTELNPAFSFPPTGRAVAHLRARLAAEATDDPELIREAEEELDEMMRSMNEERRRSGAEPIF